MARTIPVDQMTANALMAWARDNAFLWPPNGLAMIRYRSTDIKTNINMDTLKNKFLLFIRYF